MSYTAGEKSVLRMSIEELRHCYDHICNIYDQLRLKALALIAGEIAIVSFIFGTSDRLEVPKAADRRIFLSVGIIALVVAFGLLLWIISTVTWRFPHDFENAAYILKKAHSDEDEYLEYLHDDLVKDVNANLAITSPKLKKFNWSVYLLSAGAIILTSA